MLLLLSLHMQYISVALSDICAETKQNKTSGRNGSPFDFLCRCGMRAEGWACEPM